MLVADILANELDSFQEQYFKTVDTNTPKDLFIKQFSLIIDKHFQQVELSGKDVTIATASGTLGLTNTEPDLQITDLVDKIVKYWSNTITPGIPTPPNTSVTTVINTANTIAAPLTAQLKELSLRDKKEATGYSEFAKILVNNIKTIIWTCTEISPSGTPVIVPVTIVG